MSWALHLRKTVGYLGEWAVFAKAAMSWAHLKTLSLKDVATQMVHLGNRSILIAVQVSVFAGLVMALQFAHFLARLGVEYTVGKVVVVSVLRELGPVLTALSVGARIASGMTAELGAMKVTEQIDAIRALGDNPIRRLVTSRLLASALVLPMLTALADALALVSASAVVKWEYSISMKEFMVSAFNTATLDDFFSGLAKSVVFGVVIALVACFSGFQVQAGSEGVGRATTATISVCAVSVLLADFLFTRLWMAL